MTAHYFPSKDNALDALLAPLSRNELSLPEQARVLFLRARDGFALREVATSDWLCQQSFKPFADALGTSGLRVGEPGDAERFDLVALLPPRQRDEARALYARALRHLAPGGTMLAAMANNEGARTGQNDMARLLGPLQHRSRHKCRVFWGTPDAGSVDPALRRAWDALDTLQPVGDGLLSRPGLFAWNRVDAGSALLAVHLPRDLGGHVADLGAGYGYLSVQLLRHCPRVTAIDLYEAEARALPAARANLQHAQRERSHALPVGLHWHDVARGLAQRYDVIVSNPPFHQGRADQPQLGRAFIATAAAALHAEGCLWMVANRHLAYEETLAQHFAAVREVVARDGFKVIEARRPCR